jgi:dTMP kinase
LLLRLDQHTLRERQRARAQEPDRLEREGEEFFARIAGAYDALAAAEPKRIRVIDAAQPPGAVLEAALAQLSDLLS